jgi:outer membrane protein OmpA-like peptidoglycan-associated protein
MSVNLFDMFKDTVGDVLVDKASSMLGESSEATSSAMGAILPSLMGGLLKQGTSDDGASGILDFLSSNNLGGGMLDNIGDLLSGGDKTSGLLSSGSGILKYLLGDKLSSVVDLVSGSSGLKIGSTNTLMKMAGPMLMSVVGKYVKDKALDALGLKNLLLGQKDTLQKMMPAGLGDMLGLGGLFAGAKSLVDSGVKAATTAGATATGAVTSAAATTKNAASSVADTTSDAVRETAGAAKSGFGKILPWLILALAALALLWFLSRGKGGDTLKEGMDKMEQGAKDMGDAAKEGAAKTGDAIGGAVDAAGDAVGNAAEAVGDAIRSIKLPGGAEIKAAANSFTSKMADLITVKEADITKSIAFDNVDFESGSATITKASQEQLEQLASLMKAYQKVQIRVVGHTDNTGNADNNMKLSEQRAMAVKNWLGQKEIAANRIQAEGKGQTQPIASNNTEEGKVKNRRTEVFVTAR